MKLSGFVMYLFTFLVAWCAIAAGGWTVAQEFAEQSVMPWVMQIISHSYTHATSVVGASIAVIGGLLVAILLVVLLLASIAGIQRLLSLGKTK
ncbi:MAG: hypothetical protein WC028_27390 [Candidatus Obscuribacterales bacterium]|jgi:hypothetical protein